MIERFVEKLIEELGATGLLVVGLYFVLHKPLCDIAKHLRMINHELGAIYKLLIEQIRYRTHDKNEN